MVSVLGLLAPTPTFFLRNLNPGKRMTSERRIICSVGITPIGLRSDWLRAPFEQTNKAPTLPATRRKEGCPRSTNMRNRFSFPPARLGS